MGPASMQLARILGIRIGVNASWFLVLFLFVFLLTDSFTGSLDGNRTLAYLAAVAAALLFFGSIVLHELGHALAARREGIAVAGIDLFFFGGIMRMSRDTDTPGAEFRVAAAGPLVTVAIVVLGTLAGVALTGSWDAFMRAATLDSESGASPLAVLVAFLVSMNALLLVLNLVPAFPLDGGRIARAAAWKLTGDRVKATRLASVLGQGFALLLVGYGVLLAVQGAIINGLWLIILGWLLGQAAGAAVAQTRFSERLRGVTVTQVMDPDPIAIPAGTPALRAWDEYFLRFQGWKWFPVVDTDQRPVGIAQRAAVQHAALGDDQDRPIEEIAARAAPEGMIGAEEPLEVLVGAPELRARGGLLAIDADGRLRGVVTLRRVSRALGEHLAVR